MTARALVIGLGNENRGDDVAGLLVIRELRERAIPQINLLEINSDLLNLIQTWSEYELVILVDAVSGSGKSGRIHRFDAAKEALPADFHSVSTHGIGLAEAIELARSMEQLPARLIVFGIEGVDFSIGQAVSRKIAFAAKEVIDQIVDLFAIIDRC